MLGTMLIDSNIIFSLLLKQNDYKNTEKLFDNIAHFNLQIYMTDFAIYSVMLHFHRRNENPAAKIFINTLVQSANFHMYRLQPKELIECLEIDQNLDFDDKLHYYLAKKKNLTLISYDQDFNKTDLKRLTPLQALESLHLS